MVRGHRVSIYFPDHAWNRILVWQERDKKLYRSPEQLVQGEMTKRAFEEVP